jgi:hypothetical protein
MTWIWIVAGITIYSFMIGLTHRFSVRYSSFSPDGDAAFAACWIISIPTIGFIYLGHRLGDVIVNIFNRRK